MSLGLGFLILVAASIVWAVLLTIRALLWIGEIWRDEA